MTTDSNPLYNPPLSKSDDDANEREEVLIHEHLFDSSNIGVETGSNKDNNKIDETINNNLTKRLGEVDYTEVESLNYKLFLEIGIEILISTIRLSHILKGNY